MGQLHLETRCSIRLRLPTSGGNCYRGLTGNADYTEF